MANDFDWADDIPMEYIETRDLEVGKEYIARNLLVRRLNGGESFDAEGKRFVVTNIRKHPYMVEVIWTDLDDEISREDWFSVLTAGDWEPVMSNKEINESDFDWTETVSSDPIQWVRPNITMDNVERDEDNWPTQYGDGSGEVWVDFERFNNNERIQILRNIDKHLGGIWIGEGSVADSKGVKEIMCTSNRKKGLLLHCGHEDNHFFSQENHVCCMGQTYQEFKDYEIEHGYTGQDFKERPIVDGGIFLEKENLTEGFYYKGVNPTVDLIVIRGDKVLLIQRDSKAEAEPGKWALPGGFHDTNAKEGEEWKDDKETSLEAAKREVKEETGLDVDSISGLNFEMVGVFEGGGRDPRDKEDAWTRSTVYMVHIPEDEGDDVKGMDDAQRAEWVPLSLVLSRKLAFDHHKIIEKALTMNESDAFSSLSLLTESNDFEWVKDTPAHNPLESDKWIIIFNNEQEYEEVQRWLFSNGLCWDGHHLDNPEVEGCGEPWASDGPIGFFFRYGENEYSGGIDAYSYENDRVDKQPESEMNQKIKDDFSSHTKYTWSDISKYVTNLNESELDWVDDVQFKVTDEYIREILSNCEDIPITNYNTRTKSPYTKRGKMNITYYSMCPFWWDKLKDEPQDEHGRGKGEWVQSSWNTPENSVAVIMPDRNGVSDVRGMDNEDFSLITYDLKGISRYFNGEGGELWLFLDENGNIRYDLVPEHLVDEVKKGFEGVERQTTLEESFEWTDDIPSEIDVELWEKVATDIDNEVSGPHSGNMGELFPELTDVLEKYNIDISDMGEFFMFPPDGARDQDGNHITTHQLHDLHKDLIRIGVSLTPEQERELNLESVNESEFDWTDEVPAGESHRYFDINVCYHSFYDEETGEDECTEGGSYFLKIPVDVVPEIWDYEADDGYVAGPGDEGMDVIHWCVEEGLLDTTDYDDIEYVTEVSRKEFCRAWGNYQEEDKELCGRLNEDFDWVEEHEPFQPGKETYMIDFTTEDGDVSGYLGFAERKRRSQMRDVLRKLGYDVNGLGLNYQYYYLNKVKVGLGGWHVEVDNYEEGDYIYDKAREEGYTIITPTEFFEMTRGSY